MQTFLHSTADSKTSAAMAKQAKYRRLILEECRGSQEGTKEWRKQIAIAISLVDHSKLREFEEESALVSIEWQLGLPVNVTALCRVDKEASEAARKRTERPLPPDTPIAQWIMLAKRLSLFILPLNQPTSLVFPFGHSLAPPLARARASPSACTKISTTKRGLLGSTKASRSKPDAAQRYSALRERQAIASCARQMHLCLYLTRMRVYGLPF